MDVYSRKSVRTDYQPSVVREAESLNSHVDMQTLFQDLGIATAATHAA